MTEFTESKSGLMVPRNRDGKPPCGKCLICGYESYTPQDMERHVVRCAEENEPAIRAEIDKHKVGEWDDEYKDWAQGGAKDWDNWFKEHRIDRSRYDAEMAARSRRR